MSRTIRSKYRKPERETRPERSERRHKKAASRKRDRQSSRIEMRSYS